MNIIEYFYYAKNTNFLINAIYRNIALNYFRYLKVICKINIKINLKSNKEHLIIKNLYTMYLIYKPSVFLQIKIRNITF